MGARCKKCWDKLAGVHLGISQDTQVLLQSGFCCRTRIITLLLQFLTDQSSLEVTIQRESHFFLET